MYVLSTFKCVFGSEVLIQSSVEWMLGGHRYDRLFHTAVGPLLISCVTLKTELDQFWTFVLDRAHETPCCLNHRVLTPSLPPSLLVPPSSLGPRIRFPIIPSGELRTHSIVARCVTYVGD